MRILLAATLLAVTFAGIPADEKLKGIACRSVHLAYAAPEGDAFYNEVVVRKSAPGTYFCAAGWDGGYFGIQELGDGKKLAIFSVWDSAQNDPAAVKEEQRVKLLQKGEGVRVGRFGGEGSGGQSFLDLDWKVGDTYRFLVTSKVDGRRTEYAGFIRPPGDAPWVHMVTFSTVAGGKSLKGYYSFVEDFKRDRVSATQEREASFGNGWVRAKGEWRPVTKARFTADGNPVTNIDAGIRGGRFFLATGGETANQGTKLNEGMELPADPKDAAPRDLPKFE